MCVRTKTKKLQTPVSIWMCQLPGFTVSYGTRGSGGSRVSLNNNDAPSSFSCFCYVLTRKNRHQMSEWGFTLYDFLLYIESGHLSTAYLLFRVHVMICQITNKSELKTFRRMESGKHFPQDWWETDYSYLLVFLVRWQNLYEVASSLLEALSPYK